MTNQKNEQVWRVNQIEDVSIYEFGGLPRLYCPNNNISIAEIFIEWKIPQDAVAAVLTSSAVDIGPENPFQEIHFICQTVGRKKQPYYHYQPTQKIPYKIQCFDLESTHFKIIPIGDEKLPEIQRILLKIEITDARF